MKKLNPITALYLKALELISILLIKTSNKVDPYFQPDALPPQERQRLHEKAKRYRKLWRSAGYWY